MRDMEDATEVAPESTGARGGASEEQGSSEGGPRRDIEDDNANPDAHRRSSVARGGGSTLFTTLHA